MKNTIYKFSFLLCILAVVSSCTSPEAETNYTPAEYEFPTGISLATSNVTNSSFDFTYNNSGGGEGYYVVVEGGSEAPSNENVLDGSAAELIQSGIFDLTGSAAGDIVEGLCSESTYDIYAVHFTSDSFLSPNTVTISISTTGNSIAGIYDTVTNGVLSGNFGGSVVDYIGVVTITDNGDGTFTFDDTTAGIYPDLNYYGAFGSPAVPFTFDIPCNEISDAFVSPFFNCCGDFIVFDGVINADGTISVHWESAFGEVMDVVYTKQ